MYEHRLYLELASACIDELTYEERTSVPTSVFTKMMRTCAAVVTQRTPRPRPLDDVPRPPAMSYIQAYMLQPGDAVWGTHAAYNVVESVLIEDTGPKNAVHVTWCGSGTAAYGYRQPVRIAMNRTDAGDWNALRTEFDDDTVLQVVANYGGRRGA